MKFATFPIDEAEGIILAHSVSAGGVVMKKGRRLTRDDIAALKTCGRTAIMGARLSAGDVGEDEAAARMAEAIAGSGVRIAAPFTGRANLFAISAGIVRIDAGAVAAANLIDESITVACLRDGERVEAGQMIATVKIIPFAVGRPIVDRAVAAAACARIDAIPFKPHRVGLVLTRLPATKETVLAKRKRVIHDRLSGMGSSIFETLIVSHEAGDVAAALKSLAANGCAPLMVFAASAIVDRNDVIGAGIIAAGGRLERLGMPVDPGNLLLIGSLGDTSTIGIPSCAASPALNGFDWVLERVLTGHAPGSAEIARMGVGGLLKEISSRPQPRAGTSDEPKGRRAARIACLVLAGGRSSRMGTNKLVELVAGKPIVRHVVEAALGSVARPIVVVTGHRPDAIEAALVGLDVRFVHNPDYADGISTSVKTGISALSPDIDGAIVALGDMPELQAAQLDRLVAAFSPKDGRSIVVPVRNAKRGNPVLWGAGHFAEMRALAGDVGAKHLIAAHGDEIAEVDLESDAVLVDIDTPEALAALRQRSKETG